MTSDFYLNRAKIRLNLNDFSVKRDPVDFPVADAKG